MFKVSKIQLFFSKKMVKIRKNLNFLQIFKNYEYVTKELFTV